MSSDNRRRRVAGRYRSVPDFSRLAVALDSPALLTCINEISRISVHFGHGRYLCEFGHQVGKLACCRNSVTMAALDSAANGVRYRGHGIYCRGTESVEDRQYETAGENKWLPE